jgi:hypothetical protein
MHGGARGSGAPVGNQNALRHGLYAAPAREFDRHVLGLLRGGQDMLDEF